MELVNTQMLVSLLLFIVLRIRKILDFSESLNKLNFMLKRHAGFPITLQNSPDLHEPHSATTAQKVMGRGLSLPPIVPSWTRYKSDHIASKIKHAIKLKTSPARLAQLLQPSLAFCFSLQTMTAHRPVRRPWLQAKTKC